VWSLLHSGEHVRSVWDDYFEPDGSDKIRARGHMLVTTNKIRGPLSDQPNKIGEHAIAAIDHIFYGDGSQTQAPQTQAPQTQAPQTQAPEELDAWRLSLLQHIRQPLEYPSREAALRHVLPSLEVPSDHAPIVADMLLVRAGELHQTMQETRNVSDERGVLALLSERLVVLQVDEPAAESGQKSLVCGMITAVDQAGIFGFKVDNGPTLRMLGLQVTCYTCGTVCHAPGTKLLFHSDDGGIVDATVISPPTYEKEMLSNKHKLMIEGKGGEDAVKERVFDLNEFNHCCSPELSAEEFEELRQSFCNHIMRRDQMVEDAITGKQQDIEQQVLQLGIGKEMTLKTTGCQTPGRKSRRSAISSRFCFPHMERGACPGQAKPTMCCCARTRARARLGRRSSSISCLPRGLPTSTRPKSWCRC